MFNVDPPLENVSFGRLQHSIESNPRSYYQFDLGFNIVHQDGIYVTECDYSTDLFDGTTVQRWLGHYQTLLEDAITNPSLPRGRGRDTGFYL